MRISNFTTVRPNMAGTRTYEEFSKFLGERPKRLGIVANLYDDHTASYLTDAFMNSYEMDKNKKNSFQSIDTFKIEWDINVTKIERIPLVAPVTGTGLNAGDVQFHFDRNYYQKYDTFIVERTRQLFWVVSRPVRLADNDWLVVAKIQDDSYDSYVYGDLVAGDTTRFISNYHPEMHEEGYSKYQSNTEKHRTYIATHRNDGDQSAMYTAAEEVFIQIGKGKDDDPVYKLTGLEKAVFDSFMLSRNQALIWGKSNMDASGRPKFTEPETGRPVVTSDGLISQIERFADKYVIGKMNTKWLNKVLASMAMKSEKAQGNHWIFLVNSLFMNEIQDVLGAWLADHKTDGKVLYSKEANGYVKVGASFDTYEYNGNMVTFRLDRTFDIEYPDRKYGIMTDLTPDSTTGKPAMATFTFKNGQYIHNWITGVGGKNGLSSGEVSSRVAANHIVDWGYAGLAVFNPYKSVVLISEPVKNYMW